MRLIDVDKITDEEIVQYLGEKFACCMLDIRLLLAEQPTAYSVERVVKKLDDLKKEDVCMKRSCTTCKYNSECLPIECADQKVAIDRAIEIVKEG